jgi:hypothetical protein
MKHIPLAAKVKLVGWNSGVPKKKIITAFFLGNSSLRGTFQERQGFVDAFTK